MIVTETLIAIKYTPTNFISARRSGYLTQKYLLFNREFQEKNYRFMVSWSRTDGNSARTTFHSL